MDARALRVSGIGRYLREILGALFTDPRFTRIKLLGVPQDLEEFRGSVAHGEKAVICAYPYGFYSPYAQAAWLGLCATGATEADVAFFPHYDAPLLALPSRSVVTIQDLIHFKVPSAFPLWRRQAAGLLLHRAVRGAGRVLVSSESTRRDLVERFPGSDAKIEVVPFGVSRFFHAAARGGAARSVGHPYLLCVGNRKPHKNLAAAIEALALLRPDAPDLRLVVAGEWFPGWEAVLQRADALGVRDRVVEMSGVTDSALRDLYARCEALLFPSLYEGFGLPVLEAMACGAPVIASNRSSIPEVVGDAGVLVDPEDSRAMAEAVRRLRREPEFREDLVRRGRARAVKFTWERAARSTVDVLHRVAVETGAKA